MRDELPALTAVAARFFEDHVAGSWVPGYLASRGFDVAALRPWGIGYAPAEWTALTAHLRDLGFAHDAIVTAGLARRSARGSLIDLFRDRLMFPVRAPDGTVAGFIGRAPPGAAHHPPGAPAAWHLDRPHAAGHLDRPHAAGHLDRHPAAGRGPVYLNTPATPLYRKGALLFGLSEAAPALAAGARPVLAEGPLDALAITLAGAHPRPSAAPPPGRACRWRQRVPVLSADGASGWGAARADGAIGTSKPGRYVGVAPCGTALTLTQVCLVADCAGLAGVTVAFDGDPAGRRAAVRAFGLLRPAAEDITVAPLPDGADPAGYLRDRGPAALGRLLDSSGPLADLVVDAKLAGFERWLGFTDGKFLALNAVAPLVAGLPAPLVARQVARVAERLGLSHAEVTGGVTAALDLLFAEAHVL